MPPGDLRPGATVFEAEAIQVVRQNLLHFLHAQIAGADILTSLSQHQGDIGQPGILLESVFVLHPDSLGDKADVVAYFKGVLVLQGCETLMAPTAVGGHDLGACGFGLFHWGATHGFAYLGTHTVGVPSAAEGICPAVCHLHLFDARDSLQQLPSQLERSETGHMAAIVHGDQLVYAMLEGNPLQIFQQEYLRDIFL